jgi:signal transduction histidine kinase
VLRRVATLVAQLRAAQAAPPEAGELVQWLDGVAAGLDGVLEELREIARGIHPAIPAHGGLRPALKALARRSAVPVRLDVQVEGRLPEAGQTMPAAAMQVTPVFGRWASGRRMRPPARSPAHRGQEKLRIY